MVSAHSPRDNVLLDALESQPQQPFSGTLWRAVRAGRDVLQGGSFGGRWDDATFDVLYTAEKANGACAEIYFHLTQGQPVFPSKVVYHLYELQVQLERALMLPTFEALQELGLDTARYGKLCYFERELEYRRSQEIAEAANFLGFDGLVVPSARYPCRNVVIFSDAVPPSASEITYDHGPIDWAEFRKNHQLH